MILRNINSLKGGGGVFYYEDYLFYNYICMLFWELFSFKKSKRQKNCLIFFIINIICFFFQLGICSLKIYVFAFSSVLWWGSPVCWGRGCWRPPRHNPPAHQGRVVQESRPPAPAWSPTKSIGLLPGLEQVKLSGRLQGTSNHKLRKSSLFMIIFYIPLPP